MEQLPANEDDWVHPWRVGTLSRRYIAVTTDKGGVGTADHAADGELQPIATQDRGERLVVSRLR